MATHHTPENPPRCRRPDESLLEYRVAMGWDAPAPAVEKQAARHTPATQKRWKRVGHRTIVTDDLGQLLICEVFSGGIGIEEADAVEHLIAAAPEMLELLQRFARFSETTGFNYPLGSLQELHALIAKATGSAS